MREFFVGLMVMALFAILAVAGVLLLPFLLLLGLFLRLFVGLFIMLFVVWLVGKVTLLSMDYLRQNRKELP